MKLLILLALLNLLAGCATGPRFPDAFAGESRFAATRERELKLYRGVSPNLILNAATEALLDLDCTLVEGDREFGVIAARGRLESVQAQGPGATQQTLPEKRARDLNHAFMLPGFTCTCAGGDAVVTVFSTTPDHVTVRASLRDQNPRATQHFFALLDHSLAIAGDAKP